MCRILALSLLATASFAPAQAQESWHGGYFGPSVGGSAFGNASATYFAGASNVGMLNPNGLVRYDGQRIYMEGPDGFRVYAGTVAANGDLFAAASSNSQGDVLLQRVGSTWTTLPALFPRYYTVQKVLLDGQNRPCIVARSSSTGSTLRVGCLRDGAWTQYGSTGYDATVSPAKEIVVASTSVNDGTGVQTGGVYTLTATKPVGFGLRPFVQGQAVAYAPDGTLFASLRTDSAGTAYTVKKYVGTGWVTVATLNQPATKLVFTPSGDLLAWGGFDQINGAARPAGPVARYSNGTWTTFEPALPPLVNGARLQDVAYTAHGTYAFGEFAHPSADGFVGVLRLVDGEWRPVGQGRPTPVSALALRPSDGALFGGWSDFKTLGVARWDGQTWRTTPTMGTCSNDCDVRGMAFASDGKLYASGFISTLSGLGRLDEAGWARLGSTFTGAGARMATEPSGSVLFMNAGGTLTSHTGTLMRYEPGTSGPVSQSGNRGSITATGFAFAPDGTLYATGGATSYLHRWNDGWSTFGPHITEANESADGMYVAKDGRIFVAAIQAGNSGTDTPKRYRILELVGGAFQERAVLKDTSYTVYTESNNGVLGVYDWTEDAQGRVYLGGRFTHLSVNGEAGPFVPMPLVARWNGTAWDAPGGGLVFRPHSTSGTQRGFVMRLQIQGDALWAGGSFNLAAGSIPAYNIARLNGITATSSETTERVETDGLRLGPNPSRGWTTARLDRPSPATLRVVDMLGREVFRTNGTDDFRFDTSGWASGVYVVHVETERGSRTALLVVR